MKTIKKVTFKATYPVRAKGQKPAFKTTEIVEMTEADDAAIRLRAMALNWQLVSIEVVS